MTKLDELVSFILSDKLKEIRNFECYDELVAEAQKLQREQVKNINYVRQRIIDYTNWLTKQNLMICEGVDGYTFRSSMIGGKKYTAEELYDKFVSEYVA